MSLINTKPTEVVLTTEQLQAQFVAQLSQGMTQRFTGLKGFVENVMQSIFKNDKLTPVQTLAALGTNAAEVFKLGSMIAAVLNEAVPNSVDLTPPVAVTINQDGTVTLA